MGKIQVVLVDDHRPFREAVASMLTNEPDIEVVGQGSSAEEAVQLVRDRSPDVVLLDIHMPGGGLRAAKTISGASPGVRVMMLTASEEEDDVSAAFVAGVLGYIVKGIPGRELLGVVRGAYAGICYVSPRVSASAY